jgi:hypothetical protein
MAKHDWPYPNELVAMHDFTNKCRQLKDRNRKSGASI